MTLNGVRILAVAEVMQFVDLLIRNAYPPLYLPLAIVGLCLSLAGLWMIVCATWEIKKERNR